MSKLVKACIALAAFVAFAVLPASAFAVNDATIWSPTDTLLSPTHENRIPILGRNVTTDEGKEVVVPTLMTNAEGETLVSCNKAEVTGELETSTGTPNFVNEATIHKAEFTECTGFGGVVHANANPATNGLHWCLRSTGAMKTDEFQVRGGGCTVEPRPIRFVLTITSIGLTCTYQRVNPISGTYKTHPEDAIMSIEKVEFNRFESSIFCPIAGFLDMSFLLQRETTPGSERDTVYIKNHA